MHAPRTTLHVYQGRRASVVTDPIAGRTAEDVQSATLVVADQVSVSASPSTVEGALVLTAILEAEVTATLPLGSHEWQLLVVDQLDHPIDPVAEGRVIVSPTASAPDDE